MNREKTKIMRLLKNEDSTENNDKEVYEIVNEYLVTILIGQQVSVSAE